MRATWQDCVKIAAAGGGGSRSVTLRARQRGCERIRHQTTGLEARSASGLALTYVFLPRPQTASLLQKPVSPVPRRVSASLATRKVSFRLTVP